MADNNNPIKYSDLVKPDNSVTELIKQLQELRDSYSDTLKTVKSEAITVKAALKDLSGATTENRDAIRKGATDADRLTKAQRDLAFAESETAKKITELKEAQREANQLNKLQVKLNQSAEGSYNKLSAQYSINKIYLNNMTKAEREQTVEGKKLETETKAIYEEMKRLQEATGKYALNVGNYKGDILGAIKAQMEMAQELQKVKKEFENSPKAIKTNVLALKKYNDEITEIKANINELSEVTGKSAKDFKDITGESDGLIDSLAELPGVAGMAAGGFKMMKTEANKLLKQPIILIIAGIVAGLVALYSLFKKTKSGSDSLAKGGAILQGVLSMLVGVVDKLRKGLMAVFENPKKAISEFWEALKTNIVNRLESVVLLVKALGKSFESLWSRDMKGLKQAAIDAGSALIQMNTGLDAEQQKKFAEGLKNTTKELTEQVKAFADLKQAQLDNKKTNREIEKSIEELTIKEELLSATADDSTKSFKEMEEAAKRASQATIERATLARNMAANNLALINREIDLRNKNSENVDDLLDKQLEAYKTLRGAEKDYLLSVKGNQQREAQLKQDRLEKDLDILIDGFDNQKTINERIIADDKKTFEERFKLLNNTKDLFEKTFEKQIETIQKFTEKQIDSNDLINESDAVVLNQKIRNLGLSEIIEGRLLEVIRERRTMTQDLNETERDLNQKKLEYDKNEIESTKNKLKEKYDLNIRLYDEEYDLRVSEIDLLKDTEDEKTRLRLKAEKERLQKILNYNEKINKELSDNQIETLKNTIAKIDKEIALTGNESKDIYQMFGLNLDDDKKDAISESTSFALDNLSQILDANVQLADIAVQNSEKEVSAAQSKLDNEIEMRNQGYASNVSMAQKELDLAKKNQDKALKEQAKAQKQQAAIETLQQVGSLVTASAKIWAQLGFPWAIPALAIMWGSFAAAKIKANQVTKAQSESYGDGTVELLSGGSHQSGNDVDLGTKTDGTRRRAEGGEFFAVINKRSSRRFRHIIPDVINSLNGGTFAEKYLGAYQTGNVNLSVNNDSPDMRDLKADVREIRDQNRRKYYTNGNGETVETYKNLRRTYKN